MRGDKQHNVVVDFALSRDQVVDRSVGDRTKPKQGATLPQRNSRGARQLWEPVNICGTALPELCAALPTGRDLALDVWGEHSCAGDLVVRRGADRRWRPRALPASSAAKARERGSAGSPRGVAGAVSSLYAEIDAQ